MSFGGFERSQAPSQPMAHINVTPLVDVMLVLLIIFIITAPLMAYAIKLDLPSARGLALKTAPKAITLSISTEGQMVWDRVPIDQTTLQQRLAEAARSDPQPELHVRADRTTHYEHIASVMAAAQQAGLTRIGFITAPQ